MSFYCTSPRNAAGKPKYLSIPISHTSGCTQYSGSTNSPQNLLEAGSFAWPTALQPTGPLRSAAPPAGRAEAADCSGRHRARRCLWTTKTDLGAHLRPRTAVSGKPRPARHHVAVSSDWSLLTRNAPWARTDEFQSADCSPFLSFCLGCKSSAKEWLWSASSGSFCFTCITVRLWPFLSL